MIYKVRCIKTESYEMRVDANNKNEAINKAENYLIGGVEWCPNPNFKYKVNIDNNQSDNLGVIQ